MPDSLRLLALWLRDLTVDTLDEYGEELALMLVALALFAALLWLISGHVGGGA